MECGSLLPQYRDKTLEQASALQNHIMIQQTALILVAGLIFLFSFTSDQGESIPASPMGAIFLLAVFTLAPGLLSYFLGRRAIKHLADDREKQIAQLRNSRRYALLFGTMVLAGFVLEVYYLKLPVLVNRAFRYNTSYNRYLTDKTRHIRAGSTSQEYYLDEKEISRL
jgi:hypothetical protein